MTTAYTPILQLALPVTGELDGTWGSVVNDNITSMVEQAIAGFATINTWTTNSHTLTTADGATDEARCAMLYLTSDGGGNPSAAATVICPNSTKLYVVKNASGQTVTIKTAAGTGVAISNGDTTFVFCDATNVNSAVTSLVNVHVTGNLTVDGTTTLSSGTANRVLYLNASKVITDTAGFTFNGTTITVPQVSTGQVDITAQGDLRLQDTTGGEYVALQAPATLSSSYTLTMPADDGTPNQVLITDGSGVLSWSSNVFGDVYGPASATDNAVVRFDTTTGKLIQNSAVTIADDGATVISANSSAEALRITQIGAGNAILVEDSANPDSTPFAVDTSGNVISGKTTTQAIGAATPQVQLHSATASSTTDSYANFNWANSTQGAGLSLAKSKSGTIGTYGIVASGDTIGQVNFFGDDGTAFVQAASISSIVDTTPGVNDMPGRLVFSTTADGASSPTERMRIDSLGNVGIGGTPPANYNVYSVKNVTGNTTMYGITQLGVVQSDVTTNNFSFQARFSTQAASFVLANQKYFDARQGTIGAGSSVTYQTGFHADSSLIGGTYNHGFYGAIARGTNRWNLYMYGTADNYLAGKLGIGIEPYSNTQLLVNGTVQGTDVTSYGILNTTSTSTSATNTFYGMLSQVGTSVTALTNVQHFVVNQGTLNGTVTNQVGFQVNSTLTGASSSNIAFASYIDSGANRYNFYAGGTAQNVFAGQTSIGGLVGAESLRVVPVASAANYIQAAGSVSGSAVTTSAQGSDTNIDYAIAPKGTGVVSFGTLTANADAPVTGYITIKDAGGTLRKLAVIA